VPVLWAARGNHVDTARLLIRRGADLRLENDKGSTPLYWAVRYGFVELVRVLIDEVFTQLTPQFCWNKSGLLQWLLYKYDTI